MTLFRTELRFATDPAGTPYRKWRTTFYIDTSSTEAAASALGDSWINTLRSCVRDRVYAYQVYATDLDPESAIYSLIPIDPAFQRGDLSTTTDMYNFDICLAVAISVPASRPSRKFWRPGLMESDMTNGIFTNTALADLTTDAFNTIIEEGIYRDIDGDFWQAVLTIKQSNREMGRLAAFDVPAGPPLG